MRATAPSGPLSSHPTCGAGGEKGNGCVDPLQGKKDGSHAQHDVSPVAASHVEAQGDRHEACRACGRAGRPRPILNQRIRNPALRAPHRNVKVEGHRPEVCLVQRCVQPRRHRAHVGQRGAHADDLYLRSLIMRVLRSMGVGDRGGGQSRSRSLRSVLPPSSRPLLASPDSHPSSAADPKAPTHPARAPAARKRPARPPPPATTASATMARARC